MAAAGYNFGLLLHWLAEILGDLIAGHHLPFERDPGTCNRHKPLSIRVLHGQLVVVIVLIRPLESMGRVRLGRHAK
jgi:hypothetical protein